MSDNSAVESNFEIIDKNKKAMEKATNNVLKQGSKPQGTDLTQGVLNPLPGSVKKFYDGTSIFVTGGTGFLGKVLLEKLLRSCDGIKHIYILVRQKRGKDFEERHQALLKDEVFDRVREECPERLAKIKSVAGDVSMPELGLSRADYKLLEDEVNIVIHSAATVRFDEPLSVALTLNTLGTKRILELCHKIKNMKSIVHVSTAYCNTGNNFEILEKFYPVDFDPDFLLECAANLSQEIMDGITPQIMGSHVNTYTLTKALGEQIVLKYGKGLPICMFRPSIVTAAYQEPFPGWIDNLYGPTGIVCEGARGTIRSVLCKSDTVTNLIPVDLVVNACIAAAWHHTNFETPEPIIYNCTSGSVNPMTWHDFAVYSLHHARENPTNHVLLYPGFKYTTNTLVHRFRELIGHYLPSIMFDIITILQGKKPISLKILKKFRNAIDSSKYFAMNSFTFQTGNTACLISDLRASGEYSDYYCDMKPISWKKYIGIYLAGIRKYILKESMESMPAARRKIRMLYWAQLFLRVFCWICFIVMLLYLGQSLLNCNITNY